MRFIKKEEVKRFSDSLSIEDSPLSARLNSYWISFPSHQSLGFVSADRGCVA